MTPRTQGDQTRWPDLLISLPHTEVKEGTCTKVFSGRGGCGLVSEAGGRGTGQAGARGH